MTNEEILNILLDELIKENPGEYMPKEKIIKSKELSMCIKAMDIARKDTAIAFLLDTTGEMFAHNAEQLYNEFLKQTQ